MRRGRKAAGLLIGETAELPKDEPAESSAFLFSMEVNGMAREISYIELTR